MLAGLVTLQQYDADSLRAMVFLESLGLHAQALSSITPDRYRGLMRSVDPEMYGIDA